MPLLGLSSGSAKLAKWLIRAAGEAVPLGLAWLEDGLAADVEAPSTLEWRRFVVKWTRSTPVGTIEDTAQFKLDLVNVTADELDTSWTAADYAACKTPVQTFLTGMLAKWAPGQTFSELRAYRMTFNPTPDVARPFADSGAPQYVTTLTGTASGTSPNAYQLATTVTFRTAWAKHWGRIYLPSPDPSQISTYGRIIPAYMTAASSGVKTMFSSLHDAGFYPVVPVGQLDKSPFHALLGVTAVVCDDVPDVQRRRRGRMPAVRTVA